MGKSRHPERRASSKRKGEEEDECEYAYFEIWACCSCGDGGMTTAIIACSLCGHFRCTSCVLEPLELPKHRMGGDKMFAGLKRPSTSSAGAKSRASQKLYELLTTKDLWNFYVPLLLSYDARFIEKQLRRLFIIFAKELGKGARAGGEKYAARLMRCGAGDFAYRITQTQLMQERRISFLTEDPESTSHSDTDGSEVEEFGSDEHDAMISEHFQDLPGFVVHSTAFENFKDGLWLLRRYSAAAQGTGILQVLSMASAGFGEVIGALEWNKAVEVQWKCGCGKEFSESIIEYAPGAAQELASFTRDHSVIDIEHLAGSQDNNNSKPSASDGSSNLSRRRTFAGKDNLETGKGRELLTGADNEDKRFILLCRNKNNYAKLYHADITKTPCDYTSYHVLHEKYFGRFGKFWRWMSLKEISSVRFVKFHLYWGTNVSITNDNFDLLPPQKSSEYDYHADTNPPVLMTALQHFVEQPSHAPKAAKHRPRIPKKKHEPLRLDMDGSEREGYGLYFQERIRWSKVFIVEAVFATTWVLFAVLWCVRNNGRIQDGFAIAGTGIAYGTVMLGALQALGQGMV